MYDPNSMVYNKLPEAFSVPTYANKIEVKFHDSVVFTKIFNRDHEGEVKGPGSELVIRSRGEVVATPYKIGTPIAPQDIDGQARTVKVGRSWQVSRNIRDWEKLNSDIASWYDVNAAEIAAAGQRYVEDEWFADAAADLAATKFGTVNAGKAAGKGGAIDLGSADAPLVLSAKGPEAAKSDGGVNVLDFIYDMNLVWGQNEGAGQGNPYKYVIGPMEFTDRLIRFDAFYRNGTCDPLSTLLSADVTEYGQTKFSNFNYLESKRLPPVGTIEKEGRTLRVFPIFFGDTNAWTWVDLGTQSGVFDSNDTPGKHTEYHIGHYDRWLADPRYFGVAYVAL